MKTFITMLIFTYNYGGIYMKGKEVEVVRLLIENKEKELSINQIAKLLKKDYKNAHNIVSRLSKMLLLKLQPFGSSHRVTLVGKINPLIFEAEYFRRSELLKNKDIAVMHDSFKGIHSKLYVLLVFGSYAKKTQTKRSDIDLMFIVPDAEEEKLEREIQNIASTLPLRIHINIFREYDFNAMKNSKEITVGSEAIKHNVILHGIESYYELIS
ncbi:nucleotidyltransferase domain-containing protein [Candidatus Woesearchaeota archaeon]|nr:nucleotidyltransferase domain-containing protein [Candidatus Woesearchaeota archaeon]